MAITCWYSGTAFPALLQACRVPSLAWEAEEGLDVLTMAVVGELQRMWGGSARVIRQGFERLRRSGGTVAANLHSGVSLAEGPDAIPVPLQQQQLQLPDHDASLRVTTHGNQRHSGTGDAKATDHQGQQQLKETQEQDTMLRNLHVENFNWTALFPFVTPETGGIAKALLQGGTGGGNNNGDANTGLRSGGDLSGGDGNGCVATRFPSPEGMLFQDAFLMDYQGLLEPFSQGDDLFGFEDFRLS